MCANCGNRSRFEQHGCRCDWAKATRSREFFSCGYEYSHTIWNEKEWCENCKYDPPEMVPDVPFRPWPYPYLAPEGELRYR